LLEPGQKFDQPNLVAERIKTHVRLIHSRYKATFECTHYTSVKNADSRNENDKSTLHKCS